MFRRFVWATYRANMLAILRQRELNRVAGQLSEGLCLPMGLHQGCHSRLLAPRHGMQPPWVISATSSACNGRASQRI